MGNTLGDVFRIFDFLRSNSINLSYSLIGSEVDQLVDYDPRRFDLYRLDNIPQPLRDSNGIFDDGRGRYLYDFDLNEIVETFDSDDKREVIGPLALEILDKKLSKQLVRALVYSDQYCNFRAFVVPIHSRKEWRALRCKDGVSIDGGDFSIKFPANRNDVVCYHNDDWDDDED